MITTNQIARIGAMIGEPARAAMLLALMGGQALTATELTRCAHITAPTASSHLARLVAEGLLEVERQGRHRYFRLATPDIARLLESVMQIATGISSGSAGRPATACVVTGPRDGLDWSERRPHVAGAVGAAICARFLREGWVRRIGATRALEITPPGRKALLDVFGVSALE